MPDPAPSRSKAVSPATTFRSVIAELGGQADPARLATLSGVFERSVSQRLGHLLDRLDHQERTGPLSDVVSRDAPLPWIELEPAQSADPDFSPAPTGRDERWHVTVRRPPEPDT